MKFISPLTSGIARCHCIYKTTLKTNDQFHFHFRPLTARFRLAADPFPPLHLLEFGEGLRQRAPESLRNGEQKDAEKNAGNADSRLQRRRIQLLQMREETAQWVEIEVFISWTQTSFPRACE